jgi:hypothetical protein
MNMEMLQDYVGDEDCFSVGKHYIPNQYFKCPDSGIEMVFRFRIGSGWAVGPPEGKSCIPVLRYTMDTGNKIPFPETPEKYKKQERKFYDNLKKLRELDI